MNHAIFAEQVQALARRLRLLVHYCPDSRRCTGQKGFPDLIITGAGGLLFAELKIPGDYTTADQDLWIWTIFRVLGPRAVVIWQPRDLEDGTIEKRLRKIAG